MKCWDWYAVKIWDFAREGSSSGICCPNHPVIRFTRIWSNLTASFKCDWCHVGTGQLTNHTNRTWIAKEEHRAGGFYGRKTMDLIFLATLFPSTIKAVRRSDVRYTFRHVEVGRSHRMLTTEQLHVSRWRFSSTSSFQPLRGFNPSTFQSHSSFTTSHHEIWRDPQTNLLTVDFNFWST